MPKMIRARIAVLSTGSCRWLWRWARRRPAPRREWSRFRGPNGSGVTAATNLPAEFGPESNVAWQAAVPFGRSSPVVGDRQIFLTGIDGDRLVIVALDREDGNEAWRAVVDRGHTADLHRATDSATPSPVTDGENVYAFFHEAGLVSYDGEARSAGASRWGRSATTTASPRRRSWPATRLLMLCDQGRGSFLLALDKDTGEELWRRERPARLEAFSTPILLADGSIAGLRLALGRRLRPGDRREPLVPRRCRHRADLEPGRRRRPAAGQRHRPRLRGAAAVRQLAREHDADGDGELSHAELEGSWMQNHFLWIDNDGAGGISAEDWASHRGGGQRQLGRLRHPPAGRRGQARDPLELPPERALHPLAAGPRRRLLHGRGGHRHQPRRGHRQAAQARPAGQGSPKVYASPVAADGKLYVATLDGRVVVLAAGRDWQVLGLNDLGEEIYATPAIADDRLLVRTRGSLYAFAAPAAEPAPTATAGR